MSNMCGYYAGIQSVVVLIPAVYILSDWILPRYVYTSYTQILPTVDYKNV